MKKYTKFLAVALALVLTMAIGAGGTLAWLAVKSEKVENTFTYGNIDIELKETTGTDYNIVPGINIQKDPKVTVSTPRGFDDVGSYVFVKLVEQNWPAAVEASGARKVSYTLAEGWTKLEGVDDVYYREVKADADVKSFPVIKDNTITVSDTLTKGEVEAAAAVGTPKLIITAYAVQSSGMTGALDAWNKAAF